MTLRMDTSQVKRLADDLLEMRGAATPAMSKVVTASARALAQQARDRAPVDTGNLQGHIRHEVYFGLYARVVAETRYAVYVEYGTAYTPAQPFLRPASDAEEPNFYRSAAEAAYEILRYL